MAERRVVITGMGLVSPLGASMDETWENILAAKSGIKTIEGFDTEEYSVKIGGAVPDFDMSEYIPTKESRRMDGFIQFGLVAGIQALDDAGNVVPKVSGHQFQELRLVFRSGPAR